MLKPRSFKFSEDQYQKLNKMASIEGTSANAVLRKILDLYYATNYSDGEHEWGSLQKPTDSKAAALYRQIWELLEKRSKAGKNPKIHRQKYLWTMGLRANIKSHKTLKATTELLVAQGYVTNYGDYIYILRRIPLNEREAE